MPAAYLVDEADASGFIALQVHGIGNSRKPGETIHWRNIRIKTTGITPAAFPAGIYVKNNVPNQLTDYEKANGWKLLFNGSSGEGWRSAKTTSFPEHGWEIKDGALTVLSSHGNESARGGDIITENRYSTFDISFDFRLTPGANSGVKYFVTLSDGNTGSALGLEYQVLDDKLHPDAKMGRDGDRTLASLYDLMTAHKPGNAVHAIGEWNTGRIIVYPDNHVEHYLNGQKVLEYERGSAAFKQLIAISKYKNHENFGLGKEGFILLQDHGDEVSYRSIKIKVSE